jgi:hypothetical protein
MQKRKVMMKLSRSICWVVFASFTFAFQGVSHAADDIAARAVALLPASYRDEVTRALASADKNQHELINAIESVKPEQRTGIAFLIANMPQRDLTSLSKDFLVENVSLAYQAREATPWAKAIPEEIFLNDVLPYANLNEPRDRKPQAKPRSSSTP